MVENTIQEAHRATILVSVDTSAAAREATSHVGVARMMEKAVKLLPSGCRMPRMQGEGKSDLAQVVFFVGDAIEVNVKWKKGGGRCKR